MAKFTKEVIVYVQPSIPTKPRCWNYSFPGGRVIDRGHERRAADSPGET